MSRLLKNGRVIPAQPLTRPAAANDNAARAANRPLFAMTRRLLGSLEAPPPRVPAGSDVEPRWAGSS